MRRIGPPVLNRHSPQADGLLFAAPMGRDYGGLYHELVRGNHLTLPANAPAVQADVEHDLVPVFDGTNDYLVTGGNIDLSSLGSRPLTIAYWQYWPGYTDDNGISLELSEDADTEAGSFVLVPNFGDGYVLLAYQGAGSGDYSMAWMARPSAGWHHYAIGIDPSGNQNFRAYIDGVAVTVTPRGENGTLNQPWGNHPLYFMSRGGVSNWCQPGAGLRDVRFYAGHISAALAWQLWDPRTRGELYEPPARSMLVAVPQSLAYTLTADPASYTLTGSAAALRVSRRLTAASGTYALTGSPASLRVGRRITAASASYAITGSPASRRVSRRLSAEPGTYALTGQSAALRAARRLTCTAGGYALTGSPATLRVSRLLTGLTGVYSLTGEQAALRVHRLLRAEAAAYLLTGTDAELRRSVLTMLRRYVEGTVEVAARVEGEAEVAGTVSEVAEVAARIQHDVSVT